MIRFLLLILIAAVTLGIVYFATHPGIFDKVWLYLVGLAGAIVKFLQVLWQKINTFAKDVGKQLEQQQQSQTKTAAIVQNNDEAVG